jgi:hypothetical protein
VAEVVTEFEEAEDGGADLLPAEVENEIDLTGTRGQSAAKQTAAAPVVTESSPASASFTKEPLEKIPS